MNEKEKMELLMKAFDLQELAMQSVKLSQQVADCPHDIETDDFQPLHMSPRFRTQCRRLLVQIGENFGADATLVLRGFEFLDE